MRASTGPTHHADDPVQRIPPRRLAPLLALGAVVLAACGGSPTPEVEPVGGSAAGEVAPMCGELDRLTAEAPEGTGPTGTNADPSEDATVPDDQPEPTLAEEIERWAQREAADSFAGVWVDQDLGGFAVAFTDDVDGHAEAVRDEVHPGIAVAEATSSSADLNDIQERITQEEMAGDHDAAGAVRQVGAQLMINRVTVGVFDPDEDRLAELSETYGAEVICFDVEEAPTPPADAVDTLAKVAGWRDGLDDPSPFAFLEVADDLETAERAWQDNVPEDLEPRDDELPAEPGVYGELDDVDFDRQVVVVWSSGESGSCPGWVADIETIDGVVHVERDATAEMCTDDYNPYRMVLAVDRERLPTVDELPIDAVEGVPDATVRAYPTGGQ